MTVEIFVDYVCPTASSPKAPSNKHVESGAIPFVGQVVADDGYASEFGVNRQPRVGRLRTAENVHRLRVEHALDPFTRYHEVGGVAQR